MSESIIRSVGCTAMVFASVLMTTTEASAKEIPEYCHQRPAQIRLSGTQQVDGGSMVSISNWPDDPFYSYDQFKYSAWFFWDALEDGLLELDTNGSVKEVKTGVFQTPVEIPLDTLLLVCANQSDEIKSSLEKPYEELYINDDGAAGNGSSAVSFEVYQDQRLFIGVGTSEEITGSTMLKLRYTFKRKLATFIFNPQGGTQTRVLLPLYEGDETLNARGAFPSSVRGGFEFAGWFTQPEGGVRVYGDESLEDAKSIFRNFDQGGDYNLYAQWTAVDTPVTPKADASFAKQQKIFGKFMKLGGTLVGSIEIKANKKNSRKNTAQFVVYVTRCDTGKKVKSKGVLTFADDGSAVADSIAVSFKDQNLPNDTMTMRMNPDGTFTLAGSVYKMEGAQIGGALTSSSLVFNVDMPATVGWPKAPAGYQLIDAALPGDFPFTVASTGRKFSLPKGKSLKYVKISDPSGEKCYALDLNSETNPNVSMLKLSYQYKTGLFKGTFNIYASNGDVVAYTVKPKLKTSKIQIVGIVIDGKGYGVATMKGTGQNWAVTLTP